MNKAIKIRILPHLCQGYKEKEVLILEPGKTIDYQYFNQRQSVLSFPEICSEWPVQFLP
jgi:hypothetical protein